MKLATALLMLALLPLLVLYSVWSTGFVLSYLWAWYAVPLGYKAISWKVFGMMGQALWFLRPNVNASGDMKGTVAGGILFAPWVALLIGWFLQ